MITPTSINEKVTAQLNEIVSILLRKKEEISLSRTDSRIARTIGWLLQTQRTTGAWGNDNVACTSLVAISLQLLLDRAGPWGMDNEIKASLLRAGDFLLKKYSQNSFEHAVWDTSIALRALNTIDAKYHIFIRERTTWLLGLSLEHLNAGPHHIAQRTICLAELGCQKSVIKESAIVLTKILEKSHFNYSPFVLSQCLDAIRLSGIDYDLTKITEKLLSFLETTHLDSANFINICSSLHSLSHYITADIGEKLRLSIASIFGETSFRDDLTWYHDELCTAHALIALTQFTKEVVIKVPKSELIYDISKIIEEIRSINSKHSEKELTTWCLHLLCMFFAGIFLSGFMVYTSIRDNMFEWAKWALPAVFVSLISFSIQYVYRYARQIRKEPK